MSGETGMDAFMHDPAVREGLAFRQAILQWCMRSARQCAQDGQMEHSLQWSVLAARVGCMDCASLASAELERNVLSFADRLPVPQRRESPRRDRWLHVFSEAPASAGHTAMAWRWMLLDPDANRHSVVLISQNGPISKELVDAVASRGGELIQMHANAPIVERAERLRTYAWQEADVVILHVHPWDVVSTLAFGIAGGPPVLLVNHSAHLFGVGGSVADRMINTRQSVQEDDWAARYRAMGQRYVHLPLPMPAPAWRERTPEMRAAARAELGVPNDVPLLLTVGNSYKYSPLPGLDFLECAKTILARRPNAHLLAVGVFEDARWHQARIATNGRLRALGVKLDLKPYHAAADVYLEGFPFASTTAVLEAGHHGLAAVLAPIFAPFGTDGLVIDDAGMTQPRDVADYIEKVIELVDSPDERARAGQKFADAVDTHHAGAGWIAKLEALKRNLPTHHEPRLIEQPPSVPWPYVAFWSAFSSRVRADALGIVYRSAVQLGLKPRLDASVREAARKVRRTRTLHPPLRWLISCTDALVSAVPRQWSGPVYRAYEAAAGLLREDGQITRLFRTVVRS